MSPERSRFDIAAALAGAVMAPTTLLVAYIVWSWTVTGDARWIFDNMTGYVVRSLLVISLAGAAVGPWARAPFRKERGAC